MDVLLSSRAWGEKYISNPFPYLTEDLTTVEPKDLKAMQSCFMNNYKKYTAFKNE